LNELADASELATAVDQSLAPVDDGSADPRVVLRGIQAAAIAAGRPVLIFVDEVQRLATHWSNEDDSTATQQALAEIMHQHDGRIVFLLAGSERGAVEALLDEGQPLHYDGMTFPVPDIQPGDWHHGLPERFAEAGLEITPERIDQILAASGGHPQRTMRICAHVHQLTDGAAFEVSEIVVDEAIRVARGHPSWSD